MSDGMAQKIMQLRKERGLTLEQVGDAVGVGKSTVRKWENGIIANMKRDKIAALAKVLGTTTYYLMGWEEPRENHTDNLSEAKRELIEQIMTLPEEKIQLLLQVAKSIR